MLLNEPPIHCFLLTNSQNLLFLYKKIDFSLIYKGFFMKKIIALLMVLGGCLITIDALAMLRALSKVSTRRVSGQRSFSYRRPSGYGIGLLKSSLAAIEN